MILMSRIEPLNNCASGPNISIELSWKLRDCFNSFLETPVLRSLSEWHCVLNHLVFMKNNP